MAEEKAERDGRRRGPEVRRLDEPGRTGIVASLTARQLLDLAQTPACPSDMRRMMLETAWSRAVLTSDDATALAAAALIPPLDRALAHEFERWRAQPSAADRRLDAILLMARTGGLSPYAFVALDNDGPTAAHASRPKWWCARVGDDTPPVWLGCFVGEFMTPIAVREARVPDDDSPEEAATLRREIAALRAVGTAPNFFARTFIEAAKDHPGDPRVAEGLHWTIEAGHHGCTNAETQALSHRAFQVLHAQYGKSEWARRTPYWF